MSKRKWHNEVILLNHPIERIPVPIVHDAAIANRDVCGGRLIPLLFLDISDRADVKACLEAHREIQIAGEAKTAWGRRDSPHSGPITLTIRFQKPAVCTIILYFDIEKYGGLIDQITTTEALWLTYGTSSDSFLNTRDRIKILVEVESKEFRDKWDRILDKTLRDQVRRRGATKEEARLYSQRVREDWRKFGNGFAERSETRD